MAKLRRRRINEGCKMSASLVIRLVDPLIYIERA